MVFCRDCKKKVEDCEHFVTPLGISPVAVFDPKIKTLAYESNSRTLEISFKNGQVWQLFGVQPDTYDALLQQTLSSFLKFVAHRYKAAPVRISDPPAQPCPACNRLMTERHRTTGGTLRILWHCDRCNQSFWHSYGTRSVRERRERLH